MHKKAFSLNDVPSDLVFLFKKGKMPPMNQDAIRQLADTKKKINLIPEESGDLEESEIIYEIRANEVINPIWDAQVINHINMTNKRLGYLVNLMLSILAMV